MSGEKQEYRVVSKRVGKVMQTRVYRTLAAAKRRLVLFGPEPWKAYGRHGRNPDERVCCSGYQCGCGGYTVKEQSDARRAEMPELEYIKLQVRDVSEWRD